MKDEEIYQIALTMIPEIGSVLTRSLLQTMGTASAIFQAKKKELSAIEGIGERKAKLIKEFIDFSTAEKELNFIRKNNYQLLFQSDDLFPKRLLHCFDAPALLYFNGNCNLNAGKIISIVGTRNNSDYGRQITEDFIAELPTENLLILSGLAFGIDAIAHRAALKNKIATVGVLAHGLDRIYPALHRNLSKEMLANGGLLTEFRKSTLPDKHNFPKRNRIVAGMADATIVIETAIKGGSIITAELASTYNRELFAVPGKITDSKSCGCNQLIQENKAYLFSGAADFLEWMGWQEKTVVPKKQRILFYEFTNDELIIADLLRGYELKSMDELYLSSGLTSSAFAAAILSLELQGAVQSLPGKMYRMLD
ncbi:MAG: DNA-processing protein DprA [Bacteroidota bacterium]